MECIIENIEGIMIYIIPGYISYMSYRFVSLNTRSMSWNNTLLVSIAISFIINTLLLLVLTENKEWYIIITLIIAIVSGCITGILVRQTWIGDFFKKVGINRTPNGDIFSEIINNANGIMWWRISMKDSGYYFRGQFESIDDNKPLITLVHYEKRQISDQKLLFSYDEHKDYTCRVLINLENMKHIEMMEKDKKEKTNDL